MLAPICSKCKNPVDVPEDYSAGTIRCGICWAEVKLPPRSAPVTTAALLDEPLVELAAPGDPFEHVPGRPAKGLAPLEDLLRSVAKRSPSLFTPPPAVEKPSQTLATVPPRRPAAPRESEPGLRRQRGAGSSVMMEEEDYIPPAGNGSLLKLVLMMLIAVAVFIAGYYLMR